ncbi:uncharacterized protein LODBEIA_P02620 [Lodderomyces beijingensis]|uniref:Uncharacterized protein n=1 Tax=Lodderomyces beijingensis TaxID=1775926 RepID=A0ABP0ZCZ4_9ASCO
MHAPPLSFAAIATMSSVVVLYVGLKSPLKYKYLKESRISPKADLAWRDSAEKWLEDNKSVFLGGGRVFSYLSTLMKNVTIFIKIRFILNAL